MKPEHHNFRTNAGRDHLAGQLASLRCATQHLEMTARDGTKSQLLDAMELWERAIEQARDAKKTCHELLGAEVSAWIERE